MRRRHAMKSPLLERYGSFSVLRALPVFLLSTVIGSEAHADGQCRNPTPEELQSVRKLASAVQSAVVAPLLESGWQVQQHSTAFDAVVIAAHPGPARPLMVCSSLFTVHLQLDPGTPQAKALAQSVAAAANDTSIEGARKLAYALASMEIEVRTQENDPYLRAPMTGISRVQLPGVPLAYRRHPSPKEELQEVRACFGNWQNFGTDRYVLFPFAHGGGTPYIENACVTLSGMPKTLDDAVKRIEWASLNRALTP